MKITKPLLTAYVRVNILTGNYRTQHQSSDQYDATCSTG